MIVISGALVLVALVLLVLGLTMTDLDFVYGSIGVSLVSFVFLVIGILQRRGEPAGATSPPVSDDAAASDASSDAPEGKASGRPVTQAVTAGAAPAPRASARTATAEPAEEEELLPGGGPVLVVEGRPRYHVEGCRYLTGRSAEELDVLDARDDGFTACGVCKPDQVLEELYGPLDEVAPGADEQPAAPAADDVEDTGVPGGGDDEPAPTTARRGRGGSATVDLEKAAPAGTKAGGRAAAKAAATTVSAPSPAKAAPAAKAAKATSAKAAAPVKVPAKAATAKTAPAKTAPAKSTPVRSAPAKATPAKSAPVKAAKAVAEPSAEPAAAPASTARGKVVVIPDRDRFHVATCRFVRDADGTEQLTRAQAGKQGYRACGVCKP